MKRRDLLKAVAASVCVSGMAVASPPKLRAGMYRFGYCHQCKRSFEVPLESFHTHPTAAEPILKAASEWRSAHFLGCTTPLIMEHMEQVEKQMSPEVPAGITSGKAIQLL